MKLPPMHKQQAYLPSPAQIAAEAAAIRAGWTECRWMAQPPHLRPDEYRRDSVEVQRGRYCRDPDE